MTGPSVTKAGGSRGCSDNLGLSKDEAGEESKVAVTRQEYLGYDLRPQGFRDSLREQASVTLIG